MGPEWAVQVPGWPARRRRAPVGGSQCGRACPAYPFEIQHCRRFSDQALEEWYCGGA